MNGVWLYECQICHEAVNSELMPFHRFWWRHRHNLGMPEMLTASVSTHRDGSRTIRFRYPKFRGRGEAGRRGKKPLRTWLKAMPQKSLRKEPVS